MIPAGFDYHAPDSVQSAIELLGRLPTRRCATAAPLVATLPTATLTGYQNIVKAVQYAARKLREPVAT